jgi:hypothetical protein
MESTPLPIIIYVSVPREIALKARINLASPTKVLHQLFPGSEMTFCYQGQIMHDTVPFLDYQIEENTTVVAVRKSGTNQREMERFLQLSADNEGFCRMIKLLMNPNTRKEWGRLRDSAILRKEIRQRKSIPLAYMYPRPWQQLKRQEPTMIGYDLPCQPSVEPLPSCWA